MYTSDNKMFPVVVIVLACFSMMLAGCSLLSAPFQLVGGTINTVGQVISSLVGLAEKMPTPPPGVFF